MSNRLNSGQVLKPGESLYSRNGDYTFTVQEDGNVVLYNKQNKPIWASGTQNVAVKELKMQNDGNLVLYRHDDEAAWASGTDNGISDSYLIVQDDGNVCIYYPKPSWSSRYS